MIILDTDCLSLMDREGVLESSILRTSLEKFSKEEIYTTIITFEEHMRGWLSRLLQNAEVRKSRFSDMNACIDFSKAIAIQSS